MCVYLLVWGGDGEKVCGVRGGGVGCGVGEAENWCYQYLTKPSSIFMADNRADMQLSHMSGSIFITD